MIFPNLSRWSNADEVTAEQIDRSLEDRRHRMIVGISLTPRFDALHGCLLITQGRGKFLKFSHATGASIALPSAIEQACRAFAEGRERDFGQLDLTLRDLAEVQSSLVESMKRTAGKYVDRILAVAVNDPGLWSTDFDGVPSVVPMCHATQLAENSGVSVIDSFPTRDLAVGGRGGPLGALPAWLLFADRDPRVAREHRLLLDIGDTIEALLLPPSDGLDAEVPDIQHQRFSGLAVMDRAAERLTGASQNQDRLTNPVVTEAGKQLLSQWIGTAEKLIASRPSVPLRSAAGRPASSEAVVAEQELAHMMADTARTAGVEYDVFRAVACEFLLRPIQALVARAASTPRPLTPRLAPGANRARQQLVAATFERMLGYPIRSIEPLEGNVHFEALLTAALGLLHLDQLPANVTRLTGAHSQRVLGRLTPGRPANWRQLIRSMAQYHPAPMKLKDAI